MQSAPVEDPRNREGEVRREMLVKVEILPWLSSAMRPNVTGRIAFEHDLRGQTFRDLLRELAAADDGFAAVVFDTERDEMRYPALGVVNEKLLEFAGGMEHVLVEGDAVTLMAAYTGGR